MKYLLYALLSLIICPPVKAQSDVPVARWMKNPMVDGINTEWGSLNFYDDYTKLSFAIGCDSNNIYLCFESQEGRDQMKLMRAGMKVSLTTKGKPKHNASILFPLPQSRQPQQPATDSNSNSAGNQQQPHNAASFREHYILIHSVMDVSGLASVDGEVPVKDSPYIKAAINWDSASNLFYELAISKKEFFGSSYTAKDELSDIILSVEVNALSHSDAGDDNKNPVYYNGKAPQGNLQGGGFNSGHMHHENAPMHGAGAAGSTLSKKTSFKQRFVLTNSATSNQQ